MIWERSDHRELAIKMSLLEQALEQGGGIQIPDSPNPFSTCPREWLLRGETSKQHLLGCESLCPHAGQMGTSGVFFADCLSSLMYPDPGVYYIFRADDLAHDWLLAESDRYKQIASVYAQQQGLNPTKICDGIAIESFMYDSFQIYQADTGIATANYPIPIRDAGLILITRNFVSEHELDQMPSQLRRKIITLGF